MCKLGWNAAERLRKLKTLREMTGFKRKRAWVVLELCLFRYLILITLQFYPVETDTRFASYVTHIFYLNLSVIFLE